MKVNKKKVNILLSLVLIIPMLSVATIDSHATDIVTAGDLVSTSSDSLAINILTTGLGGKPIGGAELDLNVDGVLVATFTTASNGKISDSKTIHNQDMYNKIGARVSDGKLLFNVNSDVTNSAKSIKISEKKAPDGYQKNTNTWNYMLNKANDINLNIAHVNKVSTGARFVVVDSNGKPIPNVILDINQVDESGKIIQHIVNGYTDSKGTLDASTFIFGSKEIISSDGALNLSTGLYKYTVMGIGADKASGTVKVEDGKITDKQIPLTDKEKNEAQYYKETVMKSSNGGVRGNGNISSQYGNTGSKVTNDTIKRNISNTSNNTNNSSTGTKNRLARTGLEDTIGYSLAGLSLLVSGAYIFIKK